MVRLGITMGLALLAGCDGQAGVDYNGQPLAVLKGIVNNQSGIPPSYQMDAALLWRAYDPASPDAIMGASPVMIEKLFPAQFTITIFLPAPSVAFQQSTLPYAVANVGAITHGTPPDQIAGTGVLGKLADPLLYYFRSDVPHGAMELEYGPLKKGYHLIHRLKITDPATLTPAQIDGCATGLAGESSIAFADAQLECRDSLLSTSSQEVPLDTPVLLQVRNP